MILSASSTLQNATFIQPLEVLAGEAGCLEIAACYRALRSDDSKDTADRVTAFRLFHSLGTYVLRPRIRNSWMEAERQLRGNSGPEWTPKPSKSRGERPPKRLLKNFSRDLLHVFLLMPSPSPPCVGAGTPSLPCLGEGVSLEKDRSSAGSICISTAS